MAFMFRVFWPQKETRQEKAKLVERRRRTKSQMLTVFTITTNGRACLDLLGLGQDNARHGMTRQDKARQDKARQDKTRQGKTRQDKARQDKTRQDKVTQQQPKTKQYKIR